ncbi:hypothetical protein [Salicibibacter cibi]|uniref:hypothetical protein n=1 Tax=Salicibibacter cibi TaxID=2743001 RepID=UPI0031B5FB25
MKKSILILIVIGALGWAVFDFVMSSDDSTEEEVVVSDDNIDSSSPEGVEDIDESDDEVGLETGDIPLISR